MISRITQADIARKAGVHSTTVSMALRNHPSLPLETRQRIQALAESMGYRPDPNLRALMLYRRQVHVGASAVTLAYVTNFDTRWGWKNSTAHAQFYAGACAKAEQLGYRLDHFWLGEPGLTAQRLSDILSARGITGVIVASQLPTADQPLLFDWPRFSAIKIDFFPSQPELSNVTNDQTAIMRLAVRQIHAAGYRRVGLVMPAWFDDFVRQAWSAGFLVEQQRIPVEDRVPILFYPRPKDDIKGVAPVPAKTLAEWRERFRPDALVSWSPFVLPRLAELGLSVPRDLGFADIMLERYDGAMAGVRQNCERVGELAVEILAGQLQQHIFGIPRFPTASFVEGTWIDGATLPLRNGARPAVPFVPEPQAV